MKRKVCTQCGKRKPISEYYFMNHTKRRPRYKGECKTCSIARVRKYALKNRDKINARVLIKYHQNRDINIQKSRARARRFKQQCVDYKGGKCERCGYDKCPAALDFHHINPTEKDFMITSKWVTFSERVKQELDKCILICSNCHKELHYNGTSDIE